MAVAARPVVLPDQYSGEGNWSDWIDHFESVVAVNNWNADAKKLWLRVRLTGRAQKAYKRLSAETRDDFEATVRALKDRFEPESKKELYAAEFQARKKKKGEEWADFGEDIKLLADKAFPDLNDDARERLALNSYLAQLDNMQVAVGVKQQRPKTVDEAVRATLELESYMKPAAKGVAPVGLEEESGFSAVSAVQKTQEAMMGVLQNLVQRMEKLEAEGSNRSRRWPRNRGGGGGGRTREEMVCWECHEKGHLSRECPRRNQGNDNPPADWGKRWIGS